MVTKILALVIIGAALMTSSTGSRTITMEKDSINMQKAFFHPFFHPILGHGVSFGGGKLPFLGKGQGGFPSAGTGVIGGGVGSGFNGAVGNAAGDRFESGDDEANVVGGGTKGSDILGQENGARAAGSIIHP